MQKEAQKTEFVPFNCRESFCTNSGNFSTTVVVELSNLAWVPLHNSSSSKRRWRVVAIPTSGELKTFLCGRQSCCFKLFFNRVLLNSTLISQKLTKQNLCRLKMLKFSWIWWWQRVYEFMSWNWGKIGHCGKPCSKGQWLKKEGCCMSILIWIGSRMAGDSWNEAL